MYEKFGPVNHDSKIYGCLHQDEDIPIKLAIACNHIYKDLRITIHNEMRNTMSPS